MPGPEVSHGRGGAGNINPDDTEYVDGEIVRQGDVGTHGDGAYSTGRGGTSNSSPINPSHPLLFSIYIPKYPNIPQRKANFFPFSPPPKQAQQT